MKLFKLGVSLMGLCLAPLAAAQPVTATPAAAAQAAAVVVRAGLVKSSQGDVTRQRGERIEPATAGMAVAVGDTLRTGTAAYAGITLSDDTLLTLGPNSELLISAYKFDETTQDGSLLASLWRGTLSVVTGLIAKKSPQNVKVQTRTVVMAVRGTEFIVDAKQVAP